ncbi:hypothetical protein SOVF_114130, partial [Spinacia oleracea]
MVDATTRDEKEYAKVASSSDTDDQLCKLSRALVVLASASSVSREREGFLRLTPL